MLSGMLMAADEIGWQVAGLSRWTQHSLNRVSNIEIINITGASLISTSSDGVSGGPGATAGGGIAPSRSDGGDGIIG